MITPTTDIIPSHPVAWGYVRVSDDKQWDKGDSIPEQEQRIDRYYRYKLGPEGVDWAGIECDGHAVSASKTPFCNRKAGIRLLRALRSGDHLIVDKLDRLWRDSRDFENLLYWLKTHGVTLHIVNLDMLGGAIDTGGAAGELMLRILVAFAHQEARVNSERVIAHNKIARKAGRATSGKPKMGTKHVRKRSDYDRKTIHTYVAWDTDMRAMMREVVRLLEVEHLNLHQAADRIEQKLAEWNGRVFSRSAFYKRWWTEDTIERAFVCEKYLQDHNILDVRDIPVGFHKLALKYCRENGLIPWKQRPRKPSPTAEWPLNFP